MIDLKKFIVYLFVQDNELVSVYSSYGKAFIKSSCLIMILIVLASFINTYYPITQDTINNMGLIGVIFDATAVYGFLDLQTWGGKTPPENLNKKLLILFVSLGFIFGALTYLLKPL